MHALALAPPHHADDGSRNARLNPATPIAHGPAHPHRSRRAMRPRSPQRAVAPPSAWHRLHPPAPWHSAWHRRAARRVRCCPSPPLSRASQRRPALPVFRPQPARSSVAARGSSPERRGRDRQRVPAASCLDAHAAVCCPQAQLYSLRLNLPGLNKLSFTLKKEFYNKTPSHNTGHGTGAHWH